MVLVISRLYLAHISQVLELVGACWRMPELAHTQTHLSNTFAEVCLGLGVGLGVGVARPTPTPYH